ncbi:MAG TPA: EamA family transporter [Thermoanaerobaculia bacterium]|nr:EamA family transporter [Thermoanaerobaculia bacterium]
MTALKGRRLAVYLFLCAVWGSTWLVIKIGLRDLPPLKYAGLRMAIACLLLTPFALGALVGRRGSRPNAPTRRQMLLVALSGFLQIGVSYAFLFTATQWIESGLGAILFSSFPIWVGLFAHFMLPDEPLTPRTLGAAALGLAGVAVIEAPAIAGLSQHASGGLVAGGALMCGAAIVSAYSNVLNKRSFAGISPIVNVWGQTLVGSAALLLAAVVLERGAPARWTVSAAAALAYLAVFGTALTFAGLFWLIPRVPVAVIGTIPLVDTFIAVLLGSVVLGERLSARIFAGGSLILAGVLLAASPKREPAVAAS